MSGGRVVTPRWLAAIPDATLAATTLTLASADDSQPPSPPRPPMPWASRGWHDRETVGDEQDADVVTDRRAPMLPSDPPARRTPEADPTERQVPSADARHVLPDVRIRTMLERGADQIGEPADLGAHKPDAWDCSSFTQAALGRVGVRAPRTAEEQRRWLAAGFGLRAPCGHEQPGDLVFFRTHIGDSVGGHVAFVFDPGTKTSLKAHRPAGSGG